MRNRTQTHGAALMAGVAALVCSAALQAQNVSRTVVGGAGPFDHEPSRAEVIDAAAIERAGARRLDEILAELAGIQLQQASGLGTSAVVDGLPAGQLTVIVDGVPVSRPVNTRNGPTVDLASLSVPVSRIRRIEVHRGLGPAGTGDIGGIVIHVLTDRSTEIGRFDAAVSAGFVTAQSGPDAWSEGTAELAATLPLDSRWGVDLRALADRSSAVDVNGDSVPDVPSRLHLATGAGARWQGSRRRHVDLQLNVRQTETTRESLTRDEVQRLRADIPERLNGVADDRTRLGVVDLAARGRWRPGADITFRHDHTFQWQQYRFDKRYLRTGDVAPNHSTTDLSTRHAAWWTLQLGNHRLEPETVLRLQSVERTGTTNEASGYSRLLGGVGAGLGEQWQPAEALRLDARVFGELHSEFGAGGVLGGGLGWQSTPWMQLRTSASHTRRVPSAEEMWFRFDHSAVGYVLVGNPSLRPETLSGVRGGVAFESGAYGLEGEAFWNTLESAITVEADPDSPGATGVFRYVNAGRVRSAGLNVSAHARELPGGLGLQVRYAWVPHSRVDGTDERLPLTVVHDARIRLHGEWASSRASAWVEVNARSDVAPPPGAPRGGGGATLGAGAAWMVIDSLRLQVGGSNLLHHTHPDWGPKPGRMVTVGLRYTFEERT